MYIDDCLKGIDLMTHSDVTEPLNLGSSELVSINQLVDYVEAIPGVKLHRKYDLDAPKGVRGRNSDNTKTRECFDWEPSTPLLRPRGISLRSCCDRPRGATVEQRHRKGWTR